MIADDWLRSLLVRNRYRLGGILVAAVVGLALAQWQGIAVERLVTAGYVGRSFRAATPIALVAIGGLYAEKSGVFNIGVEGFMILGAVNGLAIAHVVSGGSASQLHLWIGVVGATLLSTVLTVGFAVLLIRYRANQIVAGLAVWFVGLGFGPFLSILVWDSRNSDRVGTVAELSVPVLSDVPVLGPALFDTTPFVLFTVVLVAVAWVVLYRTRYGYWIQAAGENPEALDTAGVDVDRVRYASLIFSGAMAGLAGAVLTLGVTGDFLGTGMTNVDGRGWIGIVSYLFGNYNPIGAGLAALLFGAADMLQIQLQTVGVALPAPIVDLFPYAAVIVVMTFYGSTRMPSKVGEPYESEH